MLNIEKVVPFSNASSSLHRRTGALQVDHDHEVRTTPFMLVNVFMAGVPSHGERLVHRFMREYVPMHTLIDG